MRQFALAAFLLTTVMLPLSAKAADSTSGSSSMSSYGQDYFGGQTDAEKEREEKIQRAWQYDKKYKGTVEDGEEKKSALLPSGEQFIYFVRTPNAKSNEATLRLVTPVSINGCVKMAQPLVTVRRGGGMLAFKIETGAVGVDKSVRYAHYQCHQNANVASADITLNRDELIENNIKTLTFQTGSGAMDTYNVELQGDRLTLLPKTSFAFKPFTGSSRADPLTYNFYPDNLVILYAPGAGKKTDLGEQIEKLAQSKGLTLASIPAPGNTTSGYFIDQQGTLSGSLAFDANAFVGTVIGQEKYQGANGTYEQDKNIDVYAKRPSTLD